MSRRACLIIFVRALSQGLGPETSGPKFVWQSHGILLYPSWVMRTTSTSGLLAEG